MLLRISLVLSLVVSFSSWAETGNACRPANDPFASPGVMPQGPYLGKCLKMENKRSFRRITREQAAPYIPARWFSDSRLKQAMFFANISHAGQFWVGATTGADVIQDVIFQMERFAPEWLAAHTQLRFNFKNGHAMWLFPQSGPVASEPVALASIVLSVEAVSFVGGPDYDLIKGTQGYYGLAKRMVSLTDEYMGAVEEQHKIEQFRLKFEGARASAFFALAVKQLHEPEMTSLYHTLQLNCTNTLFQVIDLFLKRPRDELSRAWTTIPVLSKGALETRNVFDDQHPLPNLDKEF